MTRKTFSQMLISARKEKGLTQEALAAAVGVDFTYISKIETGRVIHSPSERIICKMAEVLEVDAEELILAAGKVPARLADILINDELAIDFIRILPKLNIKQRAQVQSIIKEANYDKD